MSDWNDGFCFGNYYPKPVFIFDVSNKVYKPDTSETFIVKVKRIIDRLYYNQICKKYQQTMLDRIQYFCDSDRFIEFGRLQINKHNIADCAINKPSELEQRKMHPKWWWKNN